MEKLFDAASEEPRIAALWEKEGAFRAGAGKRHEQSFSIMLPPPNVTGVLHAGHAFNQSLMDILTRWHRMRGYDTLWQPGQDHAGIATQMVVERELAKEGKTRVGLGREAFIERVWEWKEHSGGTIISQMKRLGASCDWSRNRFTMDEGFHEAVIRVFVDMYEKGLIYRGKRLVNWDPHFQTAISDLEVENIETPGKMWHFKYPLQNGESYEYVEKDAEGNILFREMRDYISIATTRPETMLGDGAVAVNPDDERYRPIIGKMVEIPVGPKENRRLIPIITDPYPDPEFGSGAVKITGAHDFNDYAVAKRNQIPLYALMDDQAQMRKDGLSYAESAARASEIAQAVGEAPDVTEINLVPEELRGLDRFEARERVIAAITAEGLAVMIQNEEGESHPLVEEKPIMQPFGDRSKVVIEPMLTDQWFVDTSKIVGPAIDAVQDGRTRIMPAQHEKVYFHWLENIEPWCISRQLWWGHQIPVWYDADGKEYCAPNEAAALKMFRTAQAEAARTKGNDSLALSYEARAASDAPNHDELQRDPDVLDTWFSSGLWPMGTLGWPKQTEALERYFPTSVLVTGFDILFFWVARMMMMQYAVIGDKPFNDVYVHALVRDEKGKKMSKSLGNVLDPIELIDQYGADAVRFTFASMAAMGRDLKLSTSRIEGYRNFGTKLWNASRFASMNGAVFGQYETPPPADAAVNRWIIEETSTVFAQVDAALSAYRFNDAANSVYAFVWGIVCDWYIEFSKPLLEGQHSRETRNIMGWVIERCLILMHPFMPFITESLWGALADRKACLALTKWPETRTNIVSSEATEEMRWVISLIEAIRSARASMRVPAGAKLSIFVDDIRETNSAYYSQNTALIEKLARVEPLQQADRLPSTALNIAVEGASFGIELGGVIDLAAELVRIRKNREKIGKEISALTGRLGNERFRASAPQEVIREAEDNLAQRQEEAARLDQILSRLESMA